MRFVVTTLFAAVIAQPAAAAGPVTSSYATVVIKQGCATAVFNDNPQGAPAFAVGQAVDAVVDGKQCSGVVATVAHQLKMTHYPTFELRSYTTTVTLADRLPSPPAAP